MKLKIARIVKICWQTGAIWNVFCIYKKTGLVIYRKILRNVFLNFSNLWELLLVGECKGSQKKNRQLQ